MFKLGLLTVAILAPSLACADVADSAANGFTVKLAVSVQAPPQEVYRRLVHNVGDWWNPMHTFSGDAHNLSIDDKAMGASARNLPAAEIRHLEVVYADPGQKLVFSGALGPLQLIAATGSMTIQLTAWAARARKSLSSTL